MARLWFVPLVVLLVPVAFAGTLPAPELKDKQYVYTIPEGYLPDKIGARGLQEIQAQAARLHYPFYIVFVRDLPTETGRSTDDDTERASVGLADDWQKNPQFDRNRSTIYLLSFGPGDRKYKMLPAPLWRSELGLESDALKKYNIIFTSNAKRGDPQSGLTKLMATFDGYVFEQHDPERKAQRAAAAQARIEQEKRRQEIYREAKLMMEAQGGLDSQILRLRTLLDNDPNVLPQDADVYRKRLEDAIKVRSANNPSQMSQKFQELRYGTEVLEGFVQQRKAALAEERLQRIAIGSGAGLFGLLFALWALRRRARLKRKQSTFEQKVAQWRALLRQNGDRHYIFQETRDRVPYLKEFKGATADLYQSVSKEVDSILTGMEGMNTHIDESEKVARKATFLNPGAIDEAQLILTRSFKFDPESMESELRGFLEQLRPIEADQQINPEAFLENLSARYNAAIADWERLNKAVSMSLELPDKVFPSTGLDAMLAKAKAAGIPERWLAGHPLYGNDKTDKNLYDSLDAFRGDDPVAYVNQVNEQRQKETEVGQNLDRLVAAMEMSEAKKIDRVETFSDTVLAPDEDPSVTFANAQQNEHRLEGMLASRDSVEEIEIQAQKVHDLYQTCVEQTETIKSALRGAATTIETAKNTYNTAAQILKEAGERVEEARRIHSDTLAIVTTWQAGKTLIEAGKTDLARAEKKLAEKRHLSASRDAQAAIDRFEQAQQKAGSCNRACDDLDAAKRRYEDKLAEMGGLYSQAAGRISRYNGSPRQLEDFSPPPQTGLLDYLYLYSVLQAQEESWNATLRAAEREYEEEQRRRREREEADRRQQQAALYSHSSSSDWSSSNSGSSGGSWSSSDSGSSGGSVDSGGSGSDGGSW